ncbi:Stress response protein nst1-like protein 2 [Phlyctema vagabunda]|uniref:Stress response protein nst1-like protein 2 n=1 Tax=Phlyctema vagabunda TaxID=108571 RepID=A0ABR4P451_9HELO
MATEAQLAEKLLQDRRGLETSATPPVLAVPRNNSSNAPTLPPRGERRPPREEHRDDDVAASKPPAYTAADDARRGRIISNAWHSHDPRSSSTHSLVPSETGRDGRRKLLLVFIHGFMGNETSFQSFPAHLHNMLTVMLSATHIVHTKIYPRYKSRRAIDFARDDFGKWLEPHEDHDTDVILLGHSMGGILSAEVALQPPHSPATGQPFAHRILGTISFDTPFLGMHPGVITSGIGSLFRPAPDPPGSKPTSTRGINTPSLDRFDSASLQNQQRAASPGYVGSAHESESGTSQMSRLTSPLSTPPQGDPYFNAPFVNDVRTPERKGLDSVLHFINKHADGITAANKFNSLSSATKSYFTSHLEFGGCLADYPGLKARYTKLRALEDVKDAANSATLGYRPPVRRIRFVNYYTASTGRPKQPKIPPGFVIDKDGELKPIETEMRDMSLAAPESYSSSTPSIAVGEFRDGTVTPQQLEQAIMDSPIEVQMQNLGEDSGVQDDERELPEMRHIDSMPIEDDEEPEDNTRLPINESAPEEQEQPVVPLKPISTDPPLPPIPTMPIEPPPINLELYTDKDSRKIAEKEHKRLTKAYNQAVKDRENAIKDRKKLLEKREKKARQETEKQIKAEQKQRLKEQKEEEKRLATVNPQPRPSITSPNQSFSTNKDDKPKRDRKFCMLPAEQDGRRDKCWVRVYMEGVDEVGAHCGLFFPGPQYESLVGNVGDRVEEWVKEDCKR